MNKILAMAIASVAATAAPSVFAAEVFTSTFEDVPGGPSAGTFTFVAAADGWTGVPKIELQNNVAGAPAPNGGNVFVELDTDSNNAMSRTIAAAGIYDLSFLYSGRPNVPATSNGIQVLLDNVLVGSVTADGGPTTAWSTVSHRINASAGSVLTFRAAGTSDSLGGYLDNITLSTVAVPEPATWGMMVLGVGLLGGALRRRQSVSLRYA